MNAQTFITKTQSIFSDNAGVRRVGAKSSGPMVDEGRLAMLGAGDLRVFARKAARQFKSWRVQMLVDCSGSIVRDGKQGELSETVRGLCKALRAAQVGSVDVLGFHVKPLEISEPMLSEPGKLEEMIKREYTSHRSYGNHDGYFVREVGRKLLRAPEPGKILLVFSDGCPSCDHADRGPDGCGDPGCGTRGYNGRDSLGEDLRIALGEMRRAGLISLGVGIQAEHVREFYGETHSTSVNQLEELFTKTARLIERHVIRG